MYTSPNEIFEYGFPQSNALLKFHLNLERCKQYKAARHPTKCDVMTSNFQRYPIRCHVTKSGALQCWNLDIQFEIMFYISLQAWP